MTQYKLIMAPADRIVHELLDLEKTLAFTGRYELDQVIFRKHRGTFQMILKVTRGSGAYKAIISARTWAGVLKTAADVAATDEFQYKLDEWPSDAAKRKMELAQP